MKCLRCGAELRAGAAFCTQCGYQIPDRQRYAAKQAETDGTYRYVPKRDTPPKPVQKEPVQGKAPEGRPAQSQSVQSRPVQKKSGHSPLKKLGKALGALLRWCFKLMISCMVAGFLIVLVSELMELMELPVKIREKTESPQSKQSTINEVTEYKPVTQTDYVFYSIQELKDTLAPASIDEELDVTVHYKGNQEDIWKLTGGALLGGRSGGIATIEPEIYRIVASPYSGSKMLKAYRTGDYSNLTEDERQALYVAESVVAAARKEANNDMELELWLHDWMCRNISYYDVDFAIEFTDRRQLNAVGALLDGKANCQGYTDCFYLLGNMAGFVVDRQTMPKHIFNTIKLGGNWYIVDVTHNDQDTVQMGRDMITYRFFNVGRDYSDGRTWAPEQTRQQISEVSGSYFYYFQTDSNGYNKLYDSIDVLGESVMAACQAGQKEIHAMLLGAELTYEELFDVMNRIARKYGIRYNAYVMYNNGPGNTVYSVVFE